MRSDLIPGPPVLLEEALSLLLAKAKHLVSKEISPLSERPVKETGQALGQQGDISIERASSLTYSYL